MLLTHKRQNKKEYFEDTLVHFRQHFQSESQMKKALNVKSRNVLRQLRTASNFASKCISYHVCAV